MRTLNRIKHGLSILAIALSAQSAMAASDWQINPQGSGATDASKVSALDVGGVGYIQLTSGIDETGGFSFIEHGAYQAFAPNSNTSFPGHEITVTYTVFGTNSFANPGALNMSSGRIDIFSDTALDFATKATHYGADNGIRIGSFDIVSGYVADATGKVLVNATGIAGSFTPGYLFNNTGTDLAKLPDIRLQLAIYNQPILPDETMLAGVICGIANACGVADPNMIAAVPSGFAVQDVGSVTISAVPEPTAPAMLLVGLGLIGAIARRRR